MFNIPLIVINVFIAGQLGMQTNWTGGPGHTGPVDQWTDFYNQNNNADDGTPGEVTVESNGEASGFLQYQSILENIDEVYTMDVADLDDNGLFDVVSASWNGVITISFQESSSSWTEFEIDDLETSISLLRLEDFDGDGFDDILVCLYDQNQVLWYGNPFPGGSGWVPTAICAAGHPRAAVACDVDQDGDVDAIVASEDDGVFICNNLDGSGSVWNVEPVAPGLLPATNIAAADMDEDGDIDIMATGGEGGGIFLYTAPSWSEFTLADSIGVVEDIAAGDLDGDGDADIAAVSMTNYRARILYNPGDPSGEWTSSLVGNQKGICLILSDLDQDGDNDLVSSTPTTEQLSIHLRSGGTWLNYEFDCGTGGFSDMTLVDMDGTDPIDLVGASYYSGRTVWCPGAVQTTYYPSATITSSILQCDSLHQLFPVYLEINGDGNASIRFRASDSAENMGGWSQALEESVEDVSSFIEPGDTFCQYLVTLYSQGDFLPSTLYEIELTSTPSGTGSQGVAPFAALCPNPSSGATELRFGLAGPAEVSLAVYDLLGRVVRRTGPCEYPQGENGIVLQDLQPGLYLVRVSIGGELHGLKLVVTGGR